MKKPVVTLPMPRNVLRIFALQVGFVFEELHHVFLRIVLVLQATLLGDHLQSHLHELNMGWTWAVTWASGPKCATTAHWIDIDMDRPSYVILHPTSSYKYHVFSFCGRLGGPSQQALAFET